MLNMVLGFALAFAIGYLCRWFGVPLPAPVSLPGALLILTVTLGYLTADYLVKLSSSP